MESAFLHRVVHFFPTHATALISFSLAKVRLLPTFTLFLLMIWFSGLTALFLFLLARTAPAYLPTALSVALKPLFLFQQAQYAQVFPLKPAPLFTLYAGFGSTNKSATSLLLLSDSRSVLATLSSPPSFFYPKLCGRCGRNSLFSPPVLLGYNGSPNICFSRETTRLMSRPNGERYLHPRQSPVLFHLLSLVSTLVFSRTGGVLSHRNSLTRRFPQLPPRNLCSLVMLAVFSLVHTATDVAFCYTVIVLGLTESRILPAPPADTRPRTPLIPFCTVQLSTLCAARSLATLCLSTTSSSGPGKLPGFWGSMVFRHAPISGKGSGNQQ